MRPAGTPFVAIGGNRHPAAADWSAHGTLAFGAGRCIALWNPDDPTKRGVHATLKGHTDTVNVVRFLPAATAESELILSGSVDRTVRAWQRRDGSFALAATADGVLKGSVNAIAVCAETPGVFAAASADGTVALFACAVSAAAVAVSHLHSFSTAPRFYPLCLALSTLPSSSSALVLAAAGSSKTIAIYTAASASEPFTHSATLAGHENWLRSLAFTAEPGSTDLLLASASQDKYIRLWRLHAGSELPAATAHSESKTYGLATRLSNKAHMLRVAAQVWSITFEALLMGHEDWVYAASWHPRAADATTHRLLTASADNSLSVWAADADSGIWLTVSRLGEISDLKGSTTATGAAGGLWNGLWSPDGTAVAALTRTGAWRMWRYDAPCDRWRPAPGISGHVKDVTDVSWPPGGGYLLSTSLDQTSRLWAPWQHGGGGSWHEFSRPQIHGYDINCLSAVSRTRFVSGADEKLLRVFDQPRGVATLLEALSGVAPPTATDDLPNVANLPVLGLSNKPVDPAAPQADATLPNPALEEEDALDPPVSAPAAPPTAPPTEDTLARHTLWPEHEKLYGHGYELASLAAAPDGSVIATACKASTLEHAVIRLYETRGWREVRPPLQAHALTVTAMAFSRDAQRLLSVGRDRAWALFRRGEDGAWGLVEKREKAHARVVYGCAWIPRSACEGEAEGEGEGEGGAGERAGEGEGEGEGEGFVTVSRDKTMKLWRRSHDSWECTATVKTDAPLTAVDALPSPTRDRVWILCGDENGGLALYLLRSEGGADAVEQKLRLDARDTPDRAVTRIRWRPDDNGGQREEEGRSGAGSREVAVASEDGSVRLFRLCLDALG